MRKLRRRRIKVVAAGIGADPRPRQWRRNRDQEPRDISLRENRAGNRRADDDLDGIRLIAIRESESPLSTEFPPFSSSRNFSCCM